MNKQRYTIDEGWVQRYREGTLSEEEQAWLKAHPFEAEALEGLAERPEWTQEVSDLQQQLRDRTSRPASPWPYLRYAAALALLITAGWFTYRYATREETPAMAVTEPAAQQEEDATIQSLMHPPTAPERISGEGASPLTGSSPIAQVQRPVRSVPMPEKQVAPLSSAAASPALEEPPVLTDKAETGNQPDQETEYSPAAPALLPEISSFRAKARMSAPPEQFGHRIAGSVFSADDRVPLPGVNVVVKGTLVGTITDVNGYFSVPIPDSSEATLVFSFIGFKPEEVEVASEDSLTVALRQDGQSLAEVVVTNGRRSDDEAFYSAYPLPSRKAYRDYLEEQLRYPEEARQQGVEGTVRVSFTVEANGQPSNFRVRKSLGYGCDEEAIRLIREGPDWQPALRDGQPEAEEVTVKIRFKQ